MAVRFNVNLDGNVALALNEIARRQHEDLLRSWRECTVLISLWEPHEDRFIPLLQNFSFLIERVLGGMNEDDVEALYMPLDQVIAGSINYAFLPAEQENKSKFSVAAMTLFSFLGKSHLLADEDFVAIRDLKDQIQGKL